MKKILILLIFFSCEGGTFQEIILSNNTENNIYYFLGRNEISESDIKKIRPLKNSEIVKFYKYYKIQFESKKDSIENFEKMKTKYLVKGNDKKTIITSGNVKIFKNKKSIQQIINNEYLGKIKIFIVKESDLDLFSDKEIISKNLFIEFITIEEKDIDKNKIILEFR